MSDYTLRYVGDQALLVEFENEISMEVNQKVRALKFDLEQKRIPGMGELVPAYRALLIHYDPLRADLDRLKEAVKTSAANMDLSQLPRAVVTEIPVLYEGEYALDLEEIAGWRTRPRRRLSRFTAAATTMCTCWDSPPATPTPPGLKTISPSSGGRPPGCAFPGAASWFSWG